MLSPAALKSPASVFIGGIVDYLLGEMRKVDIRCVEDLGESEVTEFISIASRFNAPGDYAPAQISRSGGRVFRVSALVDGIPAQGEYFAYYSPFGDRFTVQMLMGLEDCIAAGNSVLDLRVRGEQLPHGFPSIAYSRLIQ